MAVAVWHWRSAQLRSSSILRPRKMSCMHWRGIRVPTCAQSNSTCHGASQRAANAAASLASKSGFTSRIGAFRGTLTQWTRPFSNLNDMGTVSSSLPRAAATTGPVAPPAAATLTAAAAAGGAAIPPASGTTAVAGLARARHNAGATKHKQAAVCYLPQAVATQGAPTCRTLNAQLRHGPLILDLRSHYHAQATRLTHTVPRRPTLRPPNTRICSATGIPRISWQSASLHVA